MLVQAEEHPKVVVQPSDYKLGRLASTLDNYFRITERGSTFGTEASAGMTTFFSMCYILALNGIIIAGPFNSGIPTRGVFFATALASGAPPTHNPSRNSSPSRIPLPGPQRAWPPASASVTYCRRLASRSRRHWPDLETRRISHAPQASSPSSWASSSTCPSPSRPAWA